MNRILNGLLTTLLLAAPLLADMGAPLGYRWVRQYRPDLGAGVQFNDIYLLPNNRIAYCGTVQLDNFNRSGWVVITDEDGGIEDQFTLASNDIGRNRYVDPYSIIDTDDGGYLVGMQLTLNRGYFQVCRLTSNGEVRWWRTYEVDERNGGACYAVIELKEGDFVACGLGSNNRAYAVRIDPDGEIVWQSHFPGKAFYAVRQNDDELIFAMEGLAGSPPMVIMGMNLDGEVQWSKAHRGGAPRALIRSFENGYAVGGKGSNTGSYLGTFTDIGSADWRANFSVDEDNDEGRTETGWGITSNRDGYLVVGEMVPSRNGRVPKSSEVFFGRNGEVIWCRSAALLPDGSVARSYRSAVTGPDGSIYLCGKSDLGPFAVCLEPVRHKPLFVERSPEDTTITCLIGDTLRFSARAVDPQGEEITYEWRVRDEVISETDSAEHIFPSLGGYQVVCIASDGRDVDSTWWNVLATTLMVTDVDPDTFNVRVQRGTEVNFFLQARAIGDDPLSYQWVLDASTGEGPMLVSDQQATSYLFEAPGLNYMYGIASRNNLRVQRVWEVDVRSTIARWEPLGNQIEAVVNDSNYFMVLPWDSLQRDWNIRWVVDGERVSGRMENYFTFNELGWHEVMVRVEDQGEIDSVNWSVFVIEAQAVNDQNSVMPSTFGVSLAPNPFNDMSLIRVALPQGNQVNMGLYDINGRLVRELSAGFLPAGWQTLKLDARGLPGGVYFVRVTAGSATDVKKAILLR